MKRRLYIPVIVALTLLATFAFGQKVFDEKMPSAQKLVAGYRSYIIVAVVLLVLLLLAIYLFKIEKKISRLEMESGSEKLR